MALLLFFVIVFGGGFALMFILMAQIAAGDRKDIEKYSAIFSRQFKHIEGLPIASGVGVWLFYSKNKIVFKKDKQEIILECEKIIDMDLCTGKTANSQIASGAIAGKYVIGGSGGAVIGSLLAANFYFIITYKKDDEKRFIVLDTAMAGTIPSKIIKHFKANHRRETEQIKL